jgi:hypothetical protein
MNLCSVFNSNPTFTAVTVTTLTVSGLTPAGFVKTATGAGGLLSTEAFGANTYIPYSSGSGFTYSANLTFDTTNGVICNLAGRFSNIAVGIAPLSTVAIRVQKDYSATLSGSVFGLTFKPYTNHSSVSTLSINAFNCYPSTYSTFDLTGLRGFFSQPTIEDGSTGTVSQVACYAAQGNIIGNGNIGTYWSYRSVSPAKSGSGTVTLAYAFRDEGMTCATTNWGCAINTQSYFNANVSIGKNTAPAVALDVVGGHRRTVSATKTTTYQILITDYTIVCEHATVAFTVTLPAASATTIGQIFHIKNIGAAIVSVDQTGTDTLDGYTTTADLSQWDCICIQGQSATGWIII